MTANAARPDKIAGQHAGPDHHAVVGHEARQAPIIAKPVLQAEQMGFLANPGGDPLQRGSGVECLGEYQHEIHRVVDVGR